MNFNSILGQKEIVTSLKSSIKSGRVGHAYIFSGPAGIGKRSMALIFAKTLLCDRQDESESCGECIQCRMFDAKSNPDFYLLEADNLSIGVDEIRNIQNDVVIKPLYSKKKVYLITDADKMTVQAQNCLLKTLEEPPWFAVIILATPSCDALIETIRSRALRYNFKKNSYSEVRSSLEAQFGSNLNGAGFIASYADGIIGTALKLAGSKEFVSIRDSTIELLVKLTQMKLADIFEMYGFFETNRDSVDTVFDIMLLFYRDILMLKKTGDENM